jgi:hypothetical protein
MHQTTRLFRTAARLSRWFEAGRVVLLVVLAALLSAVQASAQVSFNVHKGDRVEVYIGGKHYTTLFHGPKTNKPYLHPLRTADGTVITRSWPMEAVEGETKDHPHHEGVWFTHGDVNGYDLWANTKKGPKQGLVVADEAVVVKDGKTQGSITATYRWQDPNGKPLLREDRTITFYDDPANRVIDFDIRLTALDQPVKFGDTKEGTFAIRLTDALTEKKGTGTMVNAQGAKTMQEVWGKPSPWVDYSGTVSGKPVGVAIFDHPSNPKHPTTWHARDYGLFAANPFGDHDFYKDPARDGSITIQPGKHIRFRYRVVVHPGLTDAAQLQKLYGQYKQTS